jgi:biotin transporter BioY
MKADTVALIIAASGGFVIGSLVWLHVCGLFLSKVRRRTEKETWDAANLYYTRKGAGS